MMNALNDEQLQKLLEQGQVPAHQQDDPEVKTYQALYQALKQSPDLKIPPDFSAKIAARAMQQRKQRARWQSVLVIGVIVLSLLLSMLGLYYVYPSFFQYVLAHKAGVIFAFLLFIAVQAGDYWLIQKRNLARMG